jgi:hypothetical protein
MKFGGRGPSHFAAGMSTVARIAASALGISLLTAGAVAVFVTSNSVGSAALIAAGTVIVALSLLANQLESLEGGGFKIQLKAVASKLEEARLADAAGDPAEAAELRAEAQLLLAAMGPIAAEYEQVRASSPHGRERTEKMGELVQQAQQMAKLGFVDPKAIEQLFDSGQDGNRIMALGLMRGEPRLASTNIVVKAIRQPRSSFEQWQALRVSRDMVKKGDVPPGDLDAIRDAIAVAEANGSLGNASDTSRVRLAGQILQEMGADQRKGAG